MALKNTVLLLIKAPIDYEFPSCSMQHTRCTYIYAANSVYAYTSAFCCKLCGMSKRSMPSRASCWLVSSEDGVRRGGSAGMCSNCSRRCFVAKRKRKKLVNDYLLERMTKESYGGLLTELSLEKEIFKEYMRMIEYLCITDTLFCFCFWVVFWTVVAVQRPSPRLHRRRLFFLPTYR